MILQIVATRDYFFSVTLRPAWHRTLVFSSPSTQSLGISSHTGLKLTILIDLTNPLLVMLCEFPDLACVCFKLLHLKSNQFARTLHQSHEGPTTLSHTGFRLADIWLQIQSPPVRSAMLYSARLLYDSDWQFYRLQGNWL